MNIDLLKNKFKSIAKQQPASASSANCQQKTESENVSPSAQNTAGKMDELPANPPVAPDCDRPAEPLALGLIDVLTMSVEEIQKVSPTGQFSRLKLALSVAEQKDKASNDLKPTINDRPNSLVSQIPSAPFKSQQRRQLSLNDWLTLDAEELKALGVIKAD